ncbi:MAG: ATP-dependent DNA helicase [Rhodospirillaceae bacterium]|nr:ATP-dependent DNA helicase [Rhodospirillaceae bacterium]
MSESPNPTIKPSPKPTGVLMPETFALVTGVRAAYVVSMDGEIETISFNEAKKRINSGPPPLVCHGPSVAKRLGLDGFAAFDLLELFAFARPAWFAVPTPKGLAEALNLTPPSGHEDEAMVLFSATKTMLHQLATDAPFMYATCAPIAQAMQKGGWIWADVVLAALGAGKKESTKKQTSGLRIWDTLPEWEDRPPPPKATDFPVSPDEARSRLKALLSGSASEKRKEQQAFTAGITAAFDACNNMDEPIFVLAEAGTGVGKTLGYIAPASVWAEKNEGCVWISTYTRNLQRQLDGELDRLYPDPEQKNKLAVIRKGRENYFCILNFEEAYARARARPVDNIALGLIARWAMASRDGDMVGGDFPAWLEGLLGRSLSIDLTDTRGECLYSGCAHYKKCFIEHSQRRAVRARLVIANHALVMVRAMLGANGASPAAGEGGLPTRYVFDEGHHLFDAADSAFSAQLSGYETADLRRWIMGAEAGARSRSRGIKTRLEDWTVDDEKLSQSVDALRRGASILPGPGWRTRLNDGAVQGPTEELLKLIRAQVYSRDKDTGRGAYSLECPTHPIADGMNEAAKRLDGELKDIEKPAKNLCKILAQKLDDDAADLDSGARARIEGVISSIERRVIIPLCAWRSMLGVLINEVSVQPIEKKSDFVDWFSVERSRGREFDVSFNRHWVDPTKPLADALKQTAEGVLVTSATLRDEGNWEPAMARTGASHLSMPAVLVSQPSPFDYANHTRVFIANDVNKNSLDQVTGAYRELFLAAGGGGLGLFTAISRLRAVYERIAPELDKHGFNLLAQHIDPLDVGTLIDIFRLEQNTCLLGTDAVRDGIDVPGDSLRLIVFDRVPWLRPDIMAKARREHFGGRAYDEMMTRLKLKQAYGRLVRRADDRGVFVMLDGALPTRLTTAFPPGVEVKRMGLKDVINETRIFLSEQNENN